ncbi:hypothetical protein [Sporosarcina aquimarina]|uniref:Phage protein n=1 Tax=Sporosarcina aquimarina TaxID=114975 RepID=A0ABU4G0G6_9BACL|nr:hypothetical protein [Sporosarcina aquimarina]MDW0110460.1 hypothetical protein [Sporosarcina aquimarina]
MRIDTYYTTTDLSEVSMTSTTTIKLIAKKFSESIVNFGAKYNNEWRFNFREMSSIKYVIDNGRQYKQDDAVEKALMLFYGIDCKREYERI